MEARDAYVLVDGKVKRWKVDDPGCEIDGDFFWVWKSPDGEIHVSYEEWEGQAADFLGHLIGKHPELADMVVSEDSQSFAGTPVSEIVGTAVEFTNVASVGAWYHGTTSGRLDAILDEGIRGDLPWEQRSWRVAEVPPDTVYVSRSLWVAQGQADRSARGGGAAAVLEIDPSRLDPARYCEDYDFRLLPNGMAWVAGAYGGVDGVSASLSLTDNVGYQGTIPPDAIIAVHRQTPDGEWRREERPGAAPSP